MGKTKGVLATTNFDPGFIASLNGGLAPDRISVLTSELHALMSQSAQSSYKFLLFDHNTLSHACRYCQVLTTTDKTFRRVLGELEKNDFQAMLVSVARIVL